MQNYYWFHFPLGDHKMPQLSHTDDGLTSPCSPVSQLSPPIHNCPLDRFVCNLSLGINELSTPVFILVCRICCCMGFSEGTSANTLTTASSNAVILPSFPPSLENVTFPLSPRQTKTVLWWAWDSWGSFACTCSSILHVQSSGHVCMYVCMREVMYVPFSVTVK